MHSLLIYAGMGILKSVKRTGIIEDWHLAIQLWISHAFERARQALHAHSSPRPSINPPVRSRLLPSNLQPFQQPCSASVVLHRWELLALMSAFINYKARTYTVVVGVTLLAGWCGGLLGIYFLCNICKFLIQHSIAACQTSKPMPTWRRRAGSKGGRLEALSIPWQSGTAITILHPCR